MLQRRASGFWVADLYLIFAVPTGGLLLAWLLSGNSILLLTGLLLSLVTGYVRHLSLYTRNAALVSHSRLPDPGSVQISLNETNRQRIYIASVEGRDSRRWHFNFIPRGWLPEEGVFDAELYYAAKQPWPALIKTREGILFPRCRPRVAETAQ